MKKIDLFILAALLVSAVNTPAFAGYWQQEWVQSSAETYGGSPIGQFDTLGFVWTSGAKFTNTALSGFNNGGVPALPDTDWTIHNESNTFTWANSSALKDNADFFVNFEEAFGTTGSTFYYGVFKGDPGSNPNNFVLGQSYTFANNAWIYNGEVSGDTIMSLVPTNNKAPNATPEPLSSTLFLVGAAGLSLQTIRRKRSK